jgi:hypothetical protein
MGNVAYKMCGNRRRASAYVAVVSVSMIVALIGASALLAARVRRRSAQQDKEILQARFLARSGAELGVNQIISQYESSGSVPVDTWIPAGTLNDGTMSWKWIHDPDGEGLLAGRIHGKGEIGEAARIYSTKLELKEPENLVENPGVEYGLSPWEGIDGASVQVVGGAAHTGSFSLLVTNRSAWYSGGGQDLMGKIEEGQTYIFEAWVKAAYYSSDAKICAYLEGSYSGGDYYTPTSGVMITPTSWTKVTFTWTPSWGGELVDAWWKVETTSYAPIVDFYVDDAKIYKADENLSLEPASGSWRRETIE